MKKSNDIRTLTERFFQGETTLFEEQQLYRQYQEGCIPEDLLPYREMFLSIEAVKEHADSVNILSQSPGRHFGIRWIAVAASVLLLIGTGAYFLFQQREPQDECVAYVYGKKSTDITIVMDELKQAAKTMTDNKGQDNIELQLNEMFNKK